MTTDTDNTFAEHPAAAMFPLIDDDAFAALVADIREHGQREPVLVVDGELVDGRNRLRACNELGIKPIVREMTSKDAGDVHALVMSLNFHRRHLKPHEKGAALAAYMERVGAKKSKGGRPTKEPSGSRTVSVAQVAKQLGIPKQTASDQLKAAEDYKAAHPKMRAKVDSGEITAEQAAKATRSARVELSDAKETDRDREDDRKINEVYDRHAAEQREANALSRWLQSTADASQFWTSKVAKHAKEPAVAEGYLRLLERIINGASAMRDEVARLSPKRSSKGTPPAAATTDTEGETW